MLVYPYDAITKVYTGSPREAQHNPKRQGDFLIPAFSTTVEPPKTKPGQVTKFIDDKWEVVDLPPEDPIESPELTEEQKIALHNAEIKYQINVIENKQLRATREILLGQMESITYLQDIEEQIQQLRAELK